MRMSMVRALGAALVLLPLVACVPTSKYNDQIALTEKEQMRADAAEKRAGDDEATIILREREIDELNKNQKALEAKIKADEDQIASLQKSNDGLRSTLDDSRNTLKKRVADLTKEKDDLAQQLAQVTASLNAQIADLNQKIAAAEAEKQAEIAKMKANYDSITASLKSEIDQGEIQINDLKGKLTLNMVDKVLFKSGDAEVNQAGRKILDHIGQVLNQVQDKDIRIEGHTDDVPIARDLQSRYPTNWELSAARATAVARYLQDTAGVDPKRLIVTGFGEYRPIVPNDSPEHRAENRRIDIVLVPRD